MRWYTEYNAVIDVQHLYITRARNKRKMISLFSIRFSNKLKFLSFFTPLLHFRPQPSVRNISSVNNQKCMIYKIFMCLKDNKLNGISSERRIDVRKYRIRKFNQRKMKSFLYLLANMLNKYKSSRIIKI